MCQFQFEPGFRTLAKYLTFLQASQSEGYYGATTLQAFKRAWTYFFDFKARAKRIALLFMYFDIDFFKEYAKGAVSRKLIIIFQRVFFNL